MTRQRIQFIIDVGELENAIRAMHGVAQAFAGQRSVNVNSSTFRRSAVREFGQMADRRAAQYDSDIGHVYEWGDQHDKAIADSSVRLWEISISGTGKSARAKVVFHPSNEPVPIPAGEQDVPRAVHIWADKAVEQETETQWHLRAGQSAKTRVSGGQSQWLYPTLHGRKIYTKKWISYSNYTGNFQAFFEEFWAGAGQKYIEQDLNRRLKRDAEPRLYRMISNEVSRGRTVAAGLGAAAIPSPVVVQAKGRPVGLTGLNITPNAQVERRARAVIQRVMRQ